MALPIRSAQGATSIEVIGGENLFDIASKMLGDAWQWWRIAELNAVPGEPPDFIVSRAGTLLIPPVNQTITVAP